MRKKVWAALLASATLAGCVTMTPRQEQLWVRAMADKDKPELHVEMANPGLAIFLSFLLPGAGELYLGQPGAAFAWFIPGLISPFSSCVAAYYDAETVNRIRLAEAYGEYLQGLDRKGQEARPSQPDYPIVIYCNGCGRKIRADAIQCPHCGRRRM